MTGRVSILLEGPYALWDPEDPQPFADLAGSQFLEVDGNAAVIRTEGGHEMAVGPGWAVVRSGDVARFVTPEVLAGGTRS